MANRNSVGVRPSLKGSATNLYPELKMFDKPLGLADYTFYRIWFAFNHACALYFLLFVLPLNVLKLPSYLFEIGYMYLTTIGTSAGAHRYWSHRSFKANRKLEVLLMILQTASLQTPIMNWAKLHRTHHKFTDSDRDPSNINRGFWFSHIGWLTLPKHPEVEKAFGIVDFSDLAKDPVVRFQSKYYWVLIAPCFLIPIGILHLIQPELTIVQIFTFEMFRIMMHTHLLLSVNSVMHIWGYKPYDKVKGGTQNKILHLLTAGDGWHNFHHAFPWDYKSSEFFFDNQSDLFIEFFAWIGWAFDLKTVSKEHMKKRIKRTGDGNHLLSQTSNINSAKMYQKLLTKSHSQIKNGPE